ncbi:MAG TPA: OsmC family protein [Dongiaceae bacterium]|jgi:uncharacterized OsmC-like protein
MNADELSALQAPFKTKYKRDSKAAMLKLRAEGMLDNPGIACRIDTSRGLIEAGLHRATGGTGLQACSGDLLLEALVACAGVTLTGMATLLDIEVSGKVVAEGDVDLRGVLGVDEKVPVPFQEIRLRFDIESDADAKQLETLKELTERYCVIFQTLKNPPVFDVRFAVGATKTAKKKTRRA